MEANGRHWQQTKAEHLKKPAAYSRAHSQILSHIQASLKVEQCYRH